MCGASDSQNMVEQEQLDAYKQAQEMTAKEYGDQQAIYGPMAKQFKSIFDMGPNQEGFSDAEKNTLNSQAVAGTAANYNQAARAVGSSLAALGGGDELVDAGGQDQLREQVAESAAAEESKQETGIKEADYNRGYEEWLNAGQGLEAIAAGENPLGYENAATGAGSAAGTTADQIAQEDNSWINAALGAAGEIGGGLASGYCPARGTLYTMADGTQKLVELLSPGDKLRGDGNDIQTIETITPHRAAVVLVTTPSYSLRCTGMHGFVQRTAGFLRAQDAKQRWVITAMGQQRVTHVSADGEADVFDVRTTGSHTYWANDILSLGN